MKAKRFSIAGLMGLVLITALSLTALRSNSIVWSGSTFLVTAAILTLGVAGAICRKGRERAWWVGFALFGWGYLGLVIWRQVQWGILPTQVLLRTIKPDPVYGKLGIHFADAFTQVGHCLIALIAALLGGLLGRWLFGDPAVPAAVVTDPRPEIPVPRTWWRRPLVVRLTAFAAITLAAQAGLVWAPERCAALAVFATWGLLGLVAIAAICRRGKRRAACLGATSFGIGYMILIFFHNPETPNYPHVVTNQFLNDLRPSLPWIVPDLLPASNRTTAAANARLLRALGQPIRMPFAQETPLDEVLRYIHAATSEPNYPGITIYLDPQGLQEAEITDTSTITIDLEGVPLRTSLRLLLGQLGLRYAIVDGVLWITAESYEGWFLPEYEDSYLVVGHCLLALFAAMLGGLLAPLVSDP